MDKFWGISATKLGKANQWPSGDIFSDRSMANAKATLVSRNGPTFQLSMTCDDLPKHPVQGVLAMIFTGIWQAGKGWQSRFDKGVVHGYGKAGLLRGSPWCSSIESILSRLNSWLMIIGGYLYDIKVPKASCSTPQPGVGSKTNQLCLAWNMLNKWQLPGASGGDSPEGFCRATFSWIPIIADTCDECPTFHKRPNKNEAIKTLKTSKAQSLDWFWYVLVGFHRSKTCWVAELRLPDLSSIFHHAKKLGCDLSDGLRGCRIVQISWTSWYGRM